MSGRTKAGETEGADVYEVLRNVRRRYVIYYLRTRDVPVRVEELVDQIATWESAQSDGGDPSDRRRSVHNALIQTHLPKLDRHGFVEFDRRNRVVRPTERVDTVEVYPASQSVEWSRYFVILSGVALVLVTMDVFPMLPRPPESLPWEALVLVAFALLAVAYGYDQHQWRRKFRQDGPDIVIDGPLDD